MKFNTKAIHGGQHHEEVTGAVMPPVFQTSTYVQSSPGKPVGDTNTAARQTQQEQHWKTL
jgi:cystathionine beta-lyase/cystathionine gamma-synthase